MGSAAESLLNESVRGINREALLQHIKTLPRDVHAEKKFSLIHSLYPLILESSIPGTEELGILDALKIYFSLSQNELFQIGKQLEVLRRAALNGHDAGEPKKKKATFDDYLDFFREHGNPKRCLLTDQLMCDVKGKIYPLRNRLNALKALADMTGGFINPTKVEWYLELIGEALNPEILLEFVEWDERDRVKELAEKLTVNNLSSNEAYEFIVEWGCVMVERWSNPLIQNRILVLKGPQGLGKDYLIDVLTRALGFYLKLLIISRDEKEMQRVLPSALCFAVPEFDRLGKADIATLKHILTTPVSTTRDLYKNVSTNKEVRCSFISSCNVSDIVKDYTGARRFIIFDLESRVKDNQFSFEDSQQIIAQFIALQKRGDYKVSEATEAKMQSYLDSLIPGAPDDEIVDSFEEYCREDLPPMTVQVGYAPMSELNAMEHNGHRYALFERLARENNLGIKDVRHTLKRHGRYFRTNAGRFWVFDVSKVKREEEEGISVDSVNLDADSDVMF